MNNKKLETLDGYDVKFVGRHVLVTESMKDYALEKLAKLERFSPRLIDVNVSMDIQKFLHRVDLVIQFNNLIIKSHAETDDMYASIDLAVEKLQNQIRKYKDKIQDHHYQALNEIDMKVNVVQPSYEDELNDFNGDIEAENIKGLVERYRPHRVVSSETMPLKTLSLEEAIMKLELSGDVFLIYKSEEDQKLKVMYTRKDGNFGVVEPDV